MQAFLVSCLLIAGGAFLVSPAFAQTQQPAEAAGVATASVGAKTTSPAPTATKEVASEQSGTLSPQELVEVSTDRLMEVVKAHQKTYESNPEPYYRDIESVLDPVIDFDFIAKSVMGNHFKSATSEQKKAFAYTFKKGFVETFAKGMAKYNDLKMEVESPRQAVPANEKTTDVIQKIVTRDGIVQVGYKLGRKKSGNWMVINVVLESVNLGTTFRSQFAQAVKEHNGNLDAAIASWSS